MLFRVSLNLIRRISDLRGRSMKTEATVRRDGTARLTTWGRGKSALHWLDRLQGEKRVQVVPTERLTN